MIVTKEDREFEKRFLEIKKIAEAKQKSLPESFKADEVDEGIYYALLYLFLTYRYGAFTEEEYEERAKKLRPKYITRKGMRARQFESYGEMQERAKRCSQIEAALMKNKDLSYKETFNLFFEYIGALRNDCIAKGMKKNVGYSLITGCRDFTDEELELLEKGYSSIGRERKNSA